jgi:hypothetical protein
MCEYSPAAVQDGSHHLPGASLDYSRPNSPHHRLCRQSRYIWTIGIIVIVVGAILMLLGMAGHAVGGRRHYF